MFPKKGKGKKRWIDLEIMQEGKSVPLKEVKKIGGGWFIPIPKLWLSLACKPDEEGRFFVIAYIDAVSITLKGFKIDSTGRS